MNIEPIGALRRRLTLEVPVRGGDEAGSAVPAWTSLGVVWAAIAPRSGREVVTADGQAARFSHVIQIRWRGDVTAAMRLRDGATTFLIHAVHDADPRRRRLACLVEEQAS